MSSFLIPAAKLGIQNHAKFLSKKVYTVICICQVNNKNYRNHFIILMQPVALKDDADAGFMLGNKVFYRDAWI
jgi:hypothetical protein